MDSLSAEQILHTLGTVAFKKLYLKVAKFYSGDGKLSEEQIKEEIEKVFKLKEKKD